MIQEENQQNPIVTQNPQAQVGNPVRQSVLEPVKQTEAPDSSRVAVVRPESAPASIGAEPQVTPPAPGVVAPVAPAPAIPSAPAPVAPMSSPSSMPSATPAARPSLAPSIMPSISKATPSARPSATPAPARSSMPSVPGSSLSAGKPTGRSFMGGIALGVKNLAQSTLPVLESLGERGAMAKGGGFFMENPLYNKKQSLAQNIQGSPLGRLVSGLFKKK